MYEDIVIFSSENKERGRSLTPLACIFFYENKDPLKLYSHSLLEYVANLTIHRKYDSL